MKKLASVLLTIVALIFVGSNAGLIGTAQAVEDSDNYIDISEFFNEGETSDDGDSTILFDADSSASTDFWDYYSYSWDSQGEVHVIAKDDGKAIFTTGSALFTYDFETSKTNLISSTVFNYKYPVEDKLYFTDSNFVEHMVDWKNSSTATETGKKVVYYQNQNNDLTIMTDLEDKFLATQMILRNGLLDEKSYAKSYYAYSKESAYSDSNPEYLCSIHLPHAYAYNSNFMCEDRYSCWLIENYQLNLYRFGNIVRSYQLPEGKWSIITSDISLRRDQTTSEVKYIVDANNDGLITAPELNNAIVSVNVVLLNVDKLDMYTLNENGELKPVATDDTNNSKVYGEFHWTDSNGNSNQYNWSSSNTITSVNGSGTELSSLFQEFLDFMEEMGCNSSESYYYHEEGYWTFSSQG